MGEDGGELRLGAAGKMLAGWLAVRAVRAAQMQAGGAARSRCSGCAAKVQGIGRKERNLETFGASCAFQ